MLHYYDYRGHKPLDPEPSRGFTFGHFVKGLLLIVGGVMATVFFHAYWMALKS